MADEDKGYLEPVIPDDDLTGQSGDDDYGDVDLSEDEMAALKEDDDGNDDKSAEDGADDTAGDDEESFDDEKGAADDKTEDPDSDDKAKAAASQEEKTDEDDKGESESGDSGDDVDAEADAGARVPKSRLEIEVDEVDVEALNQQLTDLEGKFREGELDLQEYLAQRDTIRDQISEARLIEKVAEKIQAAEAKSEEQTWQEEQAAFFGRNKEFAEDPLLHGALNSAIAKVQQENKGLSGLELLEHGKAMVLERFKLGQASQEGDEAREKAKQEREAKRLIQEAKKKKATSDREAAPKTLGEAPAAAESLEKNKFAWLDNLEGEDFEAAIEKMTPAELEEYANAQ